MTDIPLYSEQAVTLLSKALELAKEKEGTVTFHYYDTRKPVANDAEESSSDEEDENAALSSGGSAAGESSGSEGEDDQKDTPASQAANNNTAGGNKPRKSKPMIANSKSLTQQIYRIRKQLQTVQLPLGNEEELVVPAALLHKQEVTSSSDYLKCQSLFNLARGQSEGRPVVVLLLRSGRFAGGVFHKGKCTAHKSFQRYTVRKGQGKAQSAQDSQKKAKSMGSQLRRAGEQHLKEDVLATMLEWRDWLVESSLIFVACPNQMKATLFSTEIAEFLTRKDHRIRKIPVDSGRPTVESATAIYQAVVMASIQQATTETSPVDANESSDQVEVVPQSTTTDGPAVVAKETVPIIELSPLHIAARDGDPTAILECLENGSNSIVDQLAGEDFMTPIHFAAQNEQDPVAAAACVSCLLLQGHANPTLRDGRSRLPYYLATHNKVREAFRKARAELGEEAWDWEDAKVGPALSDDDVQRRKEKDAEKKRRKKARQKEKKAKDEAQKKAAEEEERQKQEAAALRQAQGATPQPSGGTTCDFCKIQVKGRKRQQMFKRLDYSYCSTECVQNHKRELAAAAAMARLGK